MTKKEKGISVFLGIVALIIICKTGYNYADSMHWLDIFKTKGPFLSTEDLANLSEDTETKNKLADKGIYIDNLELTGEEYDDEMKNTPSDIEGMSIYDKIQMGLNAEDGSDSDNDGLSDKDEIEVYGTDPLKASTSGDLYLDGYKVAHEMDVNTSYDYKNDVTFKQNTCNYISLTLNTAEDAAAYVNELSFEEEDLAGLGFEPYKAFQIRNYSGNIEIDVSDILNDDIKEKDITVYSNCIATEIEKCDFEIDNGIITLNKDSDRDALQFFYITNKKSKPNSEVYSMGTTGMHIVLEDTYDEPYGLGAYSMWGCWLLGMKPKVYITDTGSDEMNRLVKDKFKAAINYQLYHNDIFGKFSEDEIFVIKTKDEIDRKKAFIDSLPFTKETTDPDFKHCGLSEELYSYYTYDTICKMCYGDEEEYDVRDHINFDIIEDTLPFGNFGTRYNESGMCAGLAYLTAEAYNTKQIVKKGSSGFGSFKIDELIEYDLTTDEENDTLLDYGLNNYKTKSWVKDHTKVVGTGANGEPMEIINESSLTNGEQEFVKYIVSRWAQVNQLIAAKTSYFHLGEFHYSYANVERMKAKLDENSILIGNLLVAYPIGDTKYKATAGHTINIYGYEEHKDYDYLLVYDSNYPNQEGLKIRIDKFTDSEGRQLYDYSYVTPNYKLTSTDAPLFSFSVIDECFTFYQK